MATKKKLYRNVIQIEVLSEEPIPEGFNVPEILQECVDGDYSGRITHKYTDQEVTGRKAAKMVMAHGTDPTFFMMNEFGNEIDGF